MGRFEENDVAIDELLTGPSGPVYRAVHEYAERVVHAAKVRAPVGLDAGGELRDLIQISDVEIQPGRSIKLKIGTDPIDPRNGFGYGLVAHEGHGILVAHNPSGMGFFWAKQNRFVRLPIVNATPGTPFLTDALEEVNLTGPVHFRLEPGGHDL